MSVYRSDKEKRGYNEEEGISYGAEIQQKLRFNSFEELEDYFEMNFWYFKEQKLRTKVIGKVIYIFK